MSRRRCRNVIIALLVSGGFLVSLRSVTVARFGNDKSRSKATENFHPHDINSHPVFKTKPRIVKKPSSTLTTPTTAVDRAAPAAVASLKERNPVVKFEASATIKPKVVKKNHSLSPNMPARYKKDIPALERYLAYLAKNDDPLPTQKRAVIIFTNHRSGSSFFGELFNQHPNAFYLFEPLFPLSNSSDCELRRDKKKKMLKELVQCSLPDLAPVIRDIPIEERNTRKRNMDSCLSCEVCFRDNTKELCEDEHCPRNYSRVKSCRDECGTINKRLVINECRRKFLVALKVIRMCDIRDIEEIVSELPVDIKILHLLRDPRGIANSRMQVLHRFDVKSSINGTCRRQKQNIITGLVDTPAWLKGRYMVVRYEDVALYPYAIAQSVYNFVGLNFPKALQHWIANSTGIPIPPGHLSTPQVDDFKSRQKRDVKQQNKKVTKIQPRKRWDPYGTTRDSAKTVQKWAVRLPFNTVRLIENVCAAFMEMAGYIAVGDQRSYKLNKSIKYFRSDIPSQVKLN